MFLERVFTRYIKMLRELHHGLPQRIVWFNFNLWLVAVLVVISIDITS